MYHGIPWQGTASEFAKTSPSCYQATRENHDLGAATVIPDSWLMSKDSSHDVFRIWKYLFVTRTSFQRAKQFE